MADSSNNGWARRPGGVLRVFGRKSAALDSPAAKRRPIRNTLIALAALLPVVSVLAVAAPASAHTQNMSVTSVCQNDGSYLVTYTLNYDKGVQPGQAYERTGTTLFSNGWSPSTFNDWTSLGTLTSGSGSLQWTETLPGTTTTAPWEYTYIKWSDNIVTQGDDRPENLTGNCGTAHPALTAPKITQPTCDNPQGSFTTPKSTDTVTYSSNGNVVTAMTQAPYTFSATQGWTITNSGHTATYTVTYTTLDNCPAPLTPPVITQPTCENPQGSFTTPTSTATVTYTANGNVVTATTQAPYKFSPTTGWVIGEGGRTATYTVTYTTLDDCPAPLTAPAITQPTCTSPQGSFTTPSSTTTVVYTATGSTITATTKAPYTFSASTVWLIASGGRSATYTVAFTPPLNCPVEQAPVVAPKPAITKTVNVGNDATVPVGDQLTFTVTLSNAGNAPATGDVVDTLPANVDPVPGSFTKDGAAFAPASITADTITWTGVTVAAGQTVTLVYKVTVLDAAAGTTLVNKATWQGLSASTTDSVSVGEIPSTGGGLAHTGAPFNPWSYLVWATMFLALGVIFLVFGRRDDEQED